MVKNKIICGAKNRQGDPCGNPPLQGKKRCRFHGGLSTGPKSKQGKEISSKNARKKTDGYFHLNSGNATIDDLILELQKNNSYFRELLGKK